MRTQTMTHDAAEALVRGEAPAGSPELAPLVAAIADFRAAAYATTPRPSAELMARLDLAGARGISFAAAPTRSAAATASQVTTTPESRSLRGVRRALGWFAGLGVVAKIMIGASVATAAGATGVGAVAGVSGIVATITSTIEDPAPARPDAPATEPGGGAVVPEEAPLEIGPTTEAVEDEEPPVPAESDPADPTPGNPGNNGNPGNGNPGNGNPGNGNPGNENPGNGNGEPRDNGNSGNGNPGNGNNGNGASKND